ncbi:MAG: DUF2461 domain-containing protein [Mucinivorans sp.]
MNNILEFLEELSLNNNREWFAANKSRYKAIEEEVSAFTNVLISKIALFDHTVENLTFKDCTYRIYRDVRFSPNKMPYKTHIGIYICKGGKKSGYAGYYFHFEPHNTLIATGLHCPEPKVIRSVRDEIFANGAEFQSAIDQANGFTLDRSSALKKVPKDYPTDSQYGDYLKLKDYDLVQTFDIKNDEEALNFAIEEFIKCKKFNDILNRAVEFAMQEM